MEPLFSGVSTVPEIRGLMIVVVCTRDASATCPFLKWRTVSRIEDECFMGRYLWHLQRPEFNIVPSVTHFGQPFAELFRIVNSREL